MRTHCLKILVIICILACCFGLISCSTSVGKTPENSSATTSELHFQKIAGKKEYRVVGIGMEESTDIVIPSTYKGLPVTEIGALAFDCSPGRYITSVVIGDSVTTIGDYAFKDCYSLTSVVIGDSVTTIGKDAFRNCYSLTSVVIPNSVTTIGDYAFKDCYSLTSVVIGDSVTSIGDGAFFSCYRLVEVINNSPHITVEKGSGDNGYIGDFALSVSNCDSTYVSKLTNDNSYIVYQDGEDKILVAYIGKETNLVLPNYITEINRYAFRNCTSLTSVVIGDSVTTIGILAFYNCDSLTSVVIPDSVTTIGDYAFYCCYNLTSVVIPDSVTTIGNYAFYYCSSLRSVVIGNSVTTIGNYAFSWCYSLTSVYYKGSAVKWANISIDSSNEDLIDATKYYYSAGEPTESGNFWHYDKNGNPVTW